MEDGERWYCLALGSFQSVASSAGVIMRRRVFRVGMSGPALVSELKPVAPPSRLAYQ